MASFLHPKVSSQLAPYLELEWVGPDGHTLGDGDDIFVREQSNSPDTAIRSLKIKSLSLSQLGNYTCEAKLQLPNSKQHLFTTTSYDVTAAHSKLRFYLTYSDNTVAVSNVWKGILSHYCNAVLYSLY